MSCDDAQSMLPLIQVGEIKRRAALFRASYPRRVRDSRRDLRSVFRPCDNDKARPPFCSGRAIMLESVCCGVHCTVAVALDFGRSGRVFSWLLFYHCAPVLVKVPRKQVIAVHEPTAPYLPSWQLAETNPAPNQFGEQSKAVGLFSLLACESSLSTTTGSRELAVGATYGS